jgi:hypothetical protein
LEVAHLTAALDVSESAIRNHFMLYHTWELFQENTKVDD